MVGARAVTLLSKETIISKFLSRFVSKKSRASSKKDRSSVAIYVSSLLVLVVLVSAGYESPSVEVDKDQNNLLKSSVAAAASESSNSTIDEVKAVNLAADVAKTSNLSVAESVSSQSISASTSAELEQHETDAISKPQIIDPGLKVEALSSYTAVEGDTATSIGAKFGISDQTVRWANSLTDDTVLVGTTLIIPAVDGVVYTVKNGDTLKAVADKYASSTEAIIEVNNLASEDLTVGAKLLLPGGNLPENERPGYKAPVVRRSTSSDSGSASTAYVPYAGGNTYAYGYCTWYAYNRRIQMGLTLPSNLGNANTWDERARAAGYRVDHVPSVGAIIQSDGGYYGHVGVVEKINSDGTIEISEMNNRAYGGWGKINTRHVSNPGDYDYIH